MSQEEYIAAINHKIDEQQFNNIVQLLCDVIMEPRSAYTSLLLNLFHKNLEYVSEALNTVAQFVHGVVEFSHNKQHYRVLRIDSVVNLEVLASLLYCYPNLDVAMYIIMQKDWSSSKVALGMVEREYPGKEWFSACVRSSLDMSSHLQLSQVGQLFSNLEKYLDSPQFLFTALHCFMNSFNATIKKYTIVRVLVHQVLNATAVLSNPEFISCSLLPSLCSDAAAELPRYQGTVGLMSDINELQMLRHGTGYDTVYFLKQTELTGSSNDVDRSIHQINSLTMAIIKQYWEETHQDSGWQAFSGQQAFFILLRVFFQSLGAESMDRIDMHEQVCVGPALTALLAQHVTEPSQAWQVLRGIIKFNTTFRQQIYNIISSRIKLNIGQSEYMWLVKMGVDPQCEIELTQAQWSELEKKVDYNLLQVLNSGLELVVKSQDIRDNQVSYYFRNYKVTEFNSALSLCRTLYQKKELLVELFRQKYSLSGEQMVMVRDFIVEHYCYGLDIVQSIDTKGQNTELVVKLLISIACHYPEGKQSELVKEIDNFNFNVQQSMDSLVTKIHIIAWEKLSGLVDTKICTAGAIMSTLVRIASDCNDILYMGLFERGKCTFNYQTAKYGGICQFARMARGLAVWLLENREEYDELWSSAEYFARLLATQNVIRTGRQYLEQAVALLALCMDTPYMERFLHDIVASLSVRGTQGAVSIEVSVLVIELLVQQRLGCKLVLRGLGDRLVRCVMGSNHQLRVLAKSFAVQDRVLCTALLGERLARILAEQQDEAQQHGVDSRELFATLSLNSIVTDGVYEMQHASVAPFARRHDEVLHVLGAALQQLNDPNAVARAVKHILRRCDPHADIFAENRAQVNNRDISRELAMLDEALCSESELLVSEALKEDAMVPVAQRKIGRGTGPLGCLVIVASLLDNPVNLGGIARTCEIFGCEELVLGDITITASPQFRSQAATAEQHLRITQVTPAQLSGYLSDMRGRGYMLVCLEQSTRSQYLDRVHLPQKCVALLGNESKGVPDNFLAMADICVEIPQFGLVRSLNVHVSASLIIWEYCKQQTSCRSEPVRQNQLYQQSGQPE